MSILSQRPTETVAGLGGGLAVFGFCTQVGLGQPWSAIVAVVTVVVPFIISSIVDAVSKGDMDGLPHHSPPATPAPDQGDAKAA